MDPFALIGGGLATAGSIFTNSQNIAQQQKMMDWQEQMANSAHQREVTDLKAAGLNPMLSGMKGQGAFTPSQSPVQMDNPLEGAAGAFSAAHQEKRAQQAERRAEEAHRTGLEETAARTTKELLSAAESGARANLLDQERRHGADKHAPTLSGLEAMLRVHQSQVELNQASAGQARWNSKARGLDELGTKLLQTGGEELWKLWTGSGTGAGRGLGVTPGGRSSAKGGR